MADFLGFPKIARLMREIVVTEKIDGTNAQITILEDDSIVVGSRNKFITPNDDNAGFARWVFENEAEIRRLGYGQHFGEWWGAGIQRRYGLKEKRFSLFNTAIWSDDAIRPKCCHVVPVLYQGLWSDVAIQNCLNDLAQGGSKAAPGFMDPEGVVIYHTAAKMMFKRTIKDDEKPKGSKE